MALPTISSIAPATLWTAGQLLTITGTNFKTWTIPAPTAGKLPPPIPTVQVLVGGVVATNVRVMSATQLTFFAPAHDVGTASVTVTNLDSVGVAIPGETSGSSTVTYKRPVLTDVVDIERVNTALIGVLRQQVIDNVVEYVSVDYAETTFEATMIGHLPALVLYGPTMVEADNEYVRNSNIETGGYPGTTFEARQAPEVMNLEYDLTVLTDNQKQLVSLQGVLARFFRKTRKLTIARDAADSSQGTVSYDIEKLAGAPLRTTTAPNKQDVRSFEVSFRILGVPMEGLAGFPGENLTLKGGTADTIETETVSL